MLAAAAPRAGRAHRILFVDVGNSTLGPMAEAFARHYGLDAGSAGTMPAKEFSEGALLALRERGLAPVRRRPRRVDFAKLADYERVIALGSGVAATSPDLHAQEEWPIDDPVGLDFVLHRRARDELEARIKELAREILEWSEPQGPRAAPLSS
jgi:arsenate reductase (thioredoxin)